MSWELTHEGAAVHTLASITESSADVAEVLRRASVAWDAGDRNARLYLGATGTGKSYALGEALAALSPALPGDLDDRPDTPRALGVVACETREAVSATAARIDRAGASLVALRRGRHGAALRAAQYVPAVDYVGQGLLEESTDKNKGSAERGFGHVPSSGAPGGVIASGGIRRDATLHLPALRLLGLQDDDPRVNAWGGAIALGHPLGATGAIRSATAIHALHRNKLKYSMVSMCVGMGQGAAGIFERC